MDARGDRPRARPDARACAPARGPGAVAPRSPARVGWPRRLTRQRGLSDNLSLKPDGPLIGRIVRVEALEERHREDLRTAVAAGPEILRFMAFPSDFDRWFDGALGADAEVPFAVVVAGSAVGSTRYLSFVPEHRRVEIGWTWLRRSAWGTGANIETKFLLLQHAFERHSLQRVEFKTDARNVRTRGALLALGARFEGIFHKHMVLPSGPRDSAWYAVTDDDWPAVRERLLDRLKRKFVS